MKSIDHTHELKDLGGEYITEGNDKLTVSDALVKVISGARPASAKESRTSFSVAMKLANVDFDGYLEDAEFDLCVKALEENAVGYANVVRGQVLLILDKAGEE